ncbi:MAG: BlaI/MecI/CopY family transcriptional regulator [Ruminococcaceae bacterium]|nr:BlaI/MecI/CopY family transcriptional regulator [Oscillospiraceae bacterium]
MDIKLFDSELKVMEIVWAHQPITAKDISLIARDTIGWSKNTTYTIVTKLVEKGAITRSEPNFTCCAAITIEDVRKAETNTLIEKLFGGSKKAFFSAFLSDGELTEGEIEEIKKMLDD